MIESYVWKIVGLPVMAVLFYLPSFAQGEDAASTASPNVIFILTDDQGIGDFGFMGNPYVKTPHLDELAEGSLNLTNFHVSPVCAPTRASLMTGKYSERTGVYDTYNGGAIMSDKEITIAEVLQQKGYRTGIFGKWHLGDNYPYRPMDQGFEVSLVHRGGGMGQPGDILNFFAGDSSYFNPVLFKNGKPVQTKGYCSDVFTEGLIDFVKQNSQGEKAPFFAYLSFNAPHTPLQLPDSYYELYQDLEFDPNSFAVYDEAVEKMSERDIEAAKRVFGMVSNIDDNVGKLVQSLKEEGIYDNTIIIFITDNGPQHNRYKLGLRKRKSSVFGGGIRVPCLIHYPEKFKEKRELDAATAHIDLLPSVLDLCGLDGVDHEIDGFSILAAENNALFEERTLFFEWGRGHLRRYWNFAALRRGYKLVGNTGHESEIEAFELFDVKNDPQEKDNILRSNLKLAIDLKKEMDSWYTEIVSLENNRRNFPAYIGTPYENPVLLNRNDAKGTPVAWGGESRLNYWDVKVAEEGLYNITLHFIKLVDDTGEVVLKLYPYNYSEENKEAIQKWTFENLKIQEGEYRLEPYFQTRKGEYIFPFYVSVERIDK